jgi:hypothetical protein
LQPGGDRQDVRNTVAAAWTNYLSLARTSERIFRDALEVLGGLTFRDTNADRRICQIADELVANCAKGTAKAENFLLTVPTARDALGKTLVRLIRLRFSDWTIWTLPFAAHELGRVVAKDDHSLSRRVRKLAKEFGYPERHVEEFFADVFAAYTMGPAYGCASLLLRLQPCAGFPPGDAAELAAADNPAAPRPTTGTGRSSTGRRPTDLQRAVVILKTLDWLDTRDLPAEDRRPGRGDYGTLIPELKKWWKRAVDRVGGGTDLREDDRGKLEDLAVRLRKAFDTAVAEARYPGFKFLGNHGWRIAHQWANEWRAALNSKSEPRFEPQPANTCRDVLNAAWICRLYYAKALPPQQRKDARKLIATWAIASCDAVIRAKMQGARTSQAGTGLEKAPQK